LISSELEAHILRLYHAEHWPPGTIAAQLGIHHDAVERVLEADGLPRSSFLRPSKSDPYIPFILETLKKYPSLTASRLFEMVKARGYSGQPSHFRAIVHRHRPPRFQEAYLRLRTLPGEQAQVDWAHFGKMLVGKAMRALVGFVMVLSWSRAIFLRFFLGQHLSNFLRGHVAAFERFGGIPRVLLLDNLKSAVTERIDEAIRFNPTYLQFSGHCRYEPRPVAVARGNQKGRVERAIRYIREAFFAAREWTDLDDLNRQADEWSQGPAMERRWVEDNDKTVRDAFSEEQAKLLALPANPFPTDEREEVSVQKTPYVRFDLNDYSVPHELVGRTLCVVADLQQVRIIHANEVVAVHPRSFSKKELIEDPAHIARLIDEKRQARKHRGIDRLHHAVPRTLELLEEMAQRGQNLGSAVSQLLRLLDAYGAAELEHSVAEALARGVPHPHAVRHTLERRRQEQRKPAVLPLDLPQDARVRELSVKTHDLGTYDTLKGETNHEEEAQDNAGQ
jgi:transposase